MQIAKKRRVERLTADEPIYLTVAGHARLQARLARLKRELPAAAAEAARTGTYGDRSDNAEYYKEAKGQQRRMQRQIWNIEDELKRVVEIKPGMDGAGGAAAAGVVQLGSVVTVEVVGDTRGAGSAQNATQKKFQILGTLEADPDRGIISHRSPLGAALMGKKVGEMVQIKTTRGVQGYKILFTK